MTSINTNIAAMAALSTLRSIGNDMETTQGRISSGYKVGSAADNSAYWSIATTMRSDNKALSTVQDALGLGAAKTDTAYTGLNNAIDVISEIKAKLVAAREPGVDKTKINKELSELKNQLVSTAKSASFSGENWLYRANADANDVGTKEMVGFFTRSASGDVAVGTVSFDAATSVLVDDKNAAKGQLTKDISVSEMQANGTATTKTYFLVASAGTSAAGTNVALTTSTTVYEISGMISAVDKMLTNLTDAAATLGATNKRISMQESFVGDLQDVIKKGVGRLVDADMNEESTRLKALQTQNQLGIQALSIANSTPESVLSLFR
ncbi:flagellin [Rhizobium sp. RU20A]|uniref:flagellin N-terminal helical domain-containing protein n=1 Tax=Rhizobium sp. RU20A TaxID=1907412 RepID=UPI000954DCB8|nr:flagellin [Rhizobium sp. RU20A]SIQ55731.1 flagellin [Rhizobium sp. RU20A]